VARDPIVFISYARVDGEPFAKELLQRLQGEPGIALWQDLIRMSPGDFERQLEQAIDSAQYLVMVMTPGALRSQWVEKEWRRARENGVCICPIKPTFESASTDAELNELRTKWPLWMQRIQTFDFGKYWSRFVAVLQSPCQATRSPFLAPSLPPNFVPRPLESRQIVDGILDGGHKNPSGKRVVLHGSGGFGKTTLALSVCHDEDVFTACDDGILWATLGADPSPISELTKIYAALTGERPQFANLDDATFGVAQKLAEKRCLLVVDDVWDTEQLRPFLQSAHQCSILVTTRRFNVALHEAEERCRVNVAELKVEEAQEVLTAQLQPPPIVLPRFRQLAARLGQWPLLLQLANRTLLEQVALGDSIEGALNWANEIYDEVGVVAFDVQDATAREHAISKTVELSLGLLKQDRERCLELAIFPEDAEIPLEWIGFVWQTDGRVTRAMAQRMHDLALIKVDLSRKPSDLGSGGSVRLHDATRAYFAAQLRDPARLHARLANVWRDPKRISGEYAHQYVAYHLAETMADSSQVAERGRQLLDLLTDPRYRAYQELHGDPAALHRHIILALERATNSFGPDSPGLVSALAQLQHVYAVSKHSPQLFFEAATAGHVREAEQRLDLFEAEPEWKTLARLLISWIATPQNPNEAKALSEETSASFDRPELKAVLAWVRMAPDGTPAGLPKIKADPDLAYVSSILRRAAGAETTDGTEPINYRFLASGLLNDASAFIADQDGPVLVAFAKRDPAANTQYLERYIDIHAANRYRYYRNRSLWALLKSILVYPDPQWVRQILQKMVTAVLTVAQVDFEEFLPLTILGLRARFGDQSAANKLEIHRQQFLKEAGQLGQKGSPPDEIAANNSWAHHQRRACALAEVYALALDRRPEAAELLELARTLQDGFAGFRVFSELTLAESTELVLPEERRWIDAALDSAQAAAHRIQDYPFCLRATAMVNAIRLRWCKPDIDLASVVDGFSNDPFADDFCAVHKVLEAFKFRNLDPQFRSLPIPDSVLKAKTLGQIAEAYRLKADSIVRVNRWVGIDERLTRKDTVNIPEPDFIPILAARLSALALVAPGLEDESRIALIQRLVPVSIANRTALDTILARLLLSARKTESVIPRLPFSLDVPFSQAAVGGSD
jgi:hypothetical protein